jgi:hypothetical protein
MPEFKYVDVVRLAVSAAHARIPRLQKGVANTIAEEVSAQVARGDWIDGLNKQAQTPEQFVDFYVSSRPYTEIPATVIDTQDDVWTSGSLKRQGERYRELLAYLGNEKLATAALAEEAKLYGAAVGSTKPGVKPGTKPAGQASGREDGPPMSSNPWSDTYRGTPEQALAEQTRIIRTGSERARTMAKAAGKTVLGFPLTR